MRRGSGCTMDSVEVTEAIEPSQLHLGSKILHRQAIGVKFNRNLIVNGKTRNGYEILNERRCNENFMKKKRGTRGREIGGTDAGDRNRRAVANGSRGKQNRRMNGRKRSTRCRHVAGCTRVEDPVVTCVLGGERVHGGDEGGLIPGRSGRGGGWGGRRRS